MRKVFISYRRADTEAVAGRLRDRLLTRLPTAHVFFDTGTIEGGELFAERIEQAAEAFDTMVVLIGPAWAGPIVGTERFRIWQDDDYVRREVATGLARGDKMLVLPVLVGDARVPETESLPNDLRGLRARNMMRLSNASFDNDFEALFARTQGRKTTPATGSRWVRTSVWTLVGVAVACLAMLGLAILHMAVFERPLAESLGGNATVELGSIVLVCLGAVVGFRVGARG